MSVHETVVADELMLCAESDMGCACDSNPNEMLLRAGQMTRNLHENPCGLNLDKLLERTARVIPNARDRLDCVAHTTELAVQRVLNVTDAVAPLQQHIEVVSSASSAQWQAPLDGTFDQADYRANVAHTLAT